MAPRRGITYWGLSGIFANGLKHILRGWCCVNKLPIAMGDQYIYKNRYGYGCHHRCCCRYYYRDHYLYFY